MDTRSVARLAHSSERARDVDSVTMIVIAVAAVLLVALVVVMPVAGIVDAQRFSDETWTRAGESKERWTIAMASALFVIVPIASVLGVGASAVYWLSRRQRLLAAGDAEPLHAVADVADAPLDEVPIRVVADTEIAPAGWYDDPVGRHHHRWWDGAGWTEHVADSGATSVDRVA
jgi:hypothetical protein